MKYLFILFFYASVFASPKLVFQKNQIHLDTLIQGEVKTVEFPFSNKGKKNLVIDRTRSTCGCTSTFTTKKTIEPDSGGILRVTFDSRQFRGEKEKFVLVYSNDPKKPVDTLTLNVYIKSEIDCTPRNLFFKDLRKGRTAFQEIRFFNPADSMVILESLVPSESFISTDLKTPAPIAPHDTLIVKVNVTPPDSLQRMDASIAVKINRKQPFVFSVRVFGIYAD